jgi:CRP/FNR family transcriptional regulator, cyclic AMP receptor protein
MQSLARAMRIEATCDNHSFGEDGHAGTALRAVSSSEGRGFSKFYLRNAVLFFEGSTARGAYVLRSGLVKISISSADGKKLIMRIARPGDVLGLYAGLTGRPYEATAEMLRDGRVEFVSRDGLLDLMKDRRPLALDLVEVLSKQFTEFVDHARLLMLSESALEKLARLILMWARDFGVGTSEGILLKMQLTQEEIAQIIGASRETVTRLLSALKRRHIIQVNGHEMVIRNRAALATLAQLAP